jgi:hypothetical protein
VVFEPGILKKKNQLNNDLEKKGFKTLNVADTRVVKMLRRAWCAVLKKKKNYFK